MKITLLTNILLIINLFFIISGISYSETISPVPNGINYPKGLKNWRIISSSNRTDKDTQRVILGNSIAKNAINSGQTKPWPKGSILAKLVWKNKKLQKWDAAIVPGEFVHAEIMVKDSNKYKLTGGWGFARWKGLTLQPYGEDESFAQECFSCHAPAKDEDYVFTVPAALPIE